MICFIYKDYLGQLTGLDFGPFFQTSTEGADPTMGLCGSQGNPRAKGKLGTLDPGTELKKRKKKKLTHRILCFLSSPHP